MSVSANGNAATPARVSCLPLLWSERQPDRIAVRSAAGAVTYGMLARSIASTTSMLADQRLERGDPLLIVCENSIAAAVLFCASLELGVIPSIINARLPAAELAKIAGNAQAKRTIYVSSSSPDAARHAQEIKTTSIADELWGDARIGPPNAYDAAAVTPRARERNVACVVYTAGTTGAPRGVAHSHESLIHTARLSAPAATSATQAHYYCVAPLAHIIGLGTNFLAAMWSGASIDLVARFDIHHLVAAVTSAGVTNLVCVPTIYAAILSYARQRGLKQIPNRLLSIRAAGAPLNVALKEEIDALLGVPLENGYGMTECSAIARSSSGDCPASSVGRPNVGVQVKILQPLAATADVGQTGKLLVKSPCMAVGLWREGRLTDLPELADGWLDTGDLARLDAAGNLFIVGRSKEIIIRSGFNVAPAEIEQVVCRYAGVASCAVVGCARLYDEIEIVAFIVLTPGAARVTASELEQHCKSQLAGYKRPSRFLFVDEIRLLPNGKVDRQSLLAAAADSPPSSNPK